MVEHRMRASDGLIGKLSDFYFDDQEMRIVYAVVRSGRGLLGRRVLIPPVLLGAPDHDRRLIPAALTMKQVQDAPHWDKPASPEKETQSNDDAPSLWGTAPELAALGIPLRRNHLQSIKEVCRYALWGPDGNLGRIADLVVTDKNWTIPYIIINVEDHSLPGRTVMVHTTFVKRILWNERKVDCDISRKLLAACPYFATDQVDAVFKGNRPHGESLIGSAKGLNWPVAANE